MADFSPSEIRVLGVLLEKAETTPDQYPLSLNAVTLGCNQKSSRDPVMQLDEDAVEAALDELRDRQLVFRVDMAGSRVAKFRHQLDTKWELTRAEYALLCVLLLRGPQSLGQLRQRTERIHAFRDLDEVKNTLEGMEQRELEPTVLVRELPRRPGSKDVRFTHILSPFEDEAIGEIFAGDSIAPPSPSRRDLEIQELREEVTQLKIELSELIKAFETFREQF